MSKITRFTTLSNSSIWIYKLAESEGLGSGPRPTAAFEQVSSLSIFFEAHALARGTIINWKGMVNTMTSLTRRKGNICNIRSKCTPIEPPLCRLNSWDESDGAARRECRSRVGAELDCLGCERSA
ncbi:uncharacterized protein A4U43_C03F28350 [Asparagus officinalis]|uniref:Uncharacterized protein n=1 Tax=Asparagus officinalis TaxID=4686 RepID=A0A5P1FDK6_ASPOF|nr:uncharacterized protein A4U43_C03F28350 [Asparagus officinalis]